MTRPSRPAAVRFDAALRAIVIPIDDRALSLSPARGGVAPSLQVALTPAEDKAILEGLRRAWAFEK